MLSRRRFLYGSLGLVSVGAAAAGIRWRSVGEISSRPAVERLDPRKIKQFSEPLPDLDVIDSDVLALHMRPFQAQILPRPFPKTWTWAYLLDGSEEGRQTYVGPLVLARRGRPTTIKWVNELGDAASTPIRAYRDGVDQTLHWADPKGDGDNYWNHQVIPPAPGLEGARNYRGSIPAVPHLHGAAVPAEIDGGPQAWFTSDGKKVGAAFYSKGIDVSNPKPANWAEYRYPNDQEPSVAWFHDHTLGVTRLNVYAGLAGAYLISDPGQEPPDLPPVTPLILQDRQFDVDGQLFYPAAGTDEERFAPNPEHPYWVPEFVGDVICVNGKAWPYMEVERKRYNFLILNGANARAFRLRLASENSKPAPSIYVIGTDGGYLNSPAKIVDELLVMPGERYQVMVDFADHSGNIRLLNSAPIPFPDGDEVDERTTGQVMEFRVLEAKVNDVSYNPTTRRALRGSSAAGLAPVVQLVDFKTGKLTTVVHKRRQLTLNEIMGMERTTIDPVTGMRTEFPGGPLEMLLNNTKWSGEVAHMHGALMNMSPRVDFELDPQELNALSELPNEGETELWEFINLTADAHPMHIHLVDFQILNRQEFDVDGYVKAYESAFPGGGYDHMTQKPFPPGQYIPGFGPPMNYSTGNPNALGGNPDISKFLRGGTKPTLPYEAGWKDTVVAYPGEITRIVMRFAPTDFEIEPNPLAKGYSFNPGAGWSYVWHCHILDHEDNEMMRPYFVKSLPIERGYVRGKDF